MPLSNEQALKIQNSIYTSMLGEAQQKIAQLNLQLAAAEFQIKELQEELSQCQQPTKPHNSEKEEETIMEFGES